MNKPNFDIQYENYLKEMAYGLGAGSAPVTIEQFLDVIKRFDNANKGAQPISFTSVTTPQYRKTGFLYSKLFKVGQTNGLLGNDYEANVNAQREREGKPADFVKQQTSNVKEWLSASVGITNTGLTVIKYRPLNPLPSHWVVEDLKGNLKVVEPEEVTPFLYVPKTLSQGVDKTVEYRLYGADKIVAANFQKAEYTITNVNPVFKSVFELVKGSLKT